MKEYETVKLVWCAYNQCAFGESKQNQWCVLWTKLCYITLSFTVVVTDLFTQCGVESIHCASKSIPCWKLILLSPHNIISIEPAVDDPGLLPFHLRVVSFDLVQCSQAYPKTQTQALSISNVINRSNYSVQIILVCGKEFIQYLVHVYHSVHVLFSRLTSQSECTHYELIGMQKCELHTKRQANIHGL